MRELTHRFDVWICSKSLRQQRWIALSLFFVSGVVMGVVFSTVVFHVGDWITGTTESWDWYWHAAFGLMFGLVAVWNMWNEVPPEGGFKPASKTNRGEAE